MAKDILEISETNNFNKCKRLNHLQNKNFLNYQYCEY